MKRGIIRKRRDRDGAKVHRSSFQGDVQGLGLLSNCNGLRKIPNVGDIQGVGFWRNVQLEVALIIRAGIVAVLTGADDSFGQRLTCSFVYDLAFDDRLGKSDGINK